jgi:glycyl-tRNA synthetase beta chain
MVIIEPERRRELIRDAGRAAARTVEGRPHEAPDLIEEVTFMAEHPTVALGSFPPEYLSLPAEILITTMQRHQKYFAVRAFSEEPTLLPNFLAFRDGGEAGLDIVRSGYEKVLRARLADAKFFFDHDRQRSLAEWAERLATISFQERLGSLAGKATRLEWLARRLAPAAGMDVERAARAARLLKADLATNVVRELTELQGTMGQVYARLAGESDEVAEAIFEHYLPRFSGDGLPETRLGQLMSAIDKVDSLVGFFAVGLAPTGSQDPYALRRQGSGLVATLVEAGFPFSIEGLVSDGVAAYLSGGRPEATPSAAPKAADFARGANELREFLGGRVRSFLEEQGYRYDVIEAVIGGGADVLVDITARAEALTAFRQTDGFADAVVAFSRAANLGGRTPERDPDPQLLTHPAEISLYEQFVKVRDRARELLRGRRYREFLATVADLRSGVDRFFDDVLVMVEDESVRNNRLALLKGISSLVAGVADFGKLVVSREELAGREREGDGR